MNFYRIVSGSYVYCNDQTLQPTNTLNHPHSPHSPRARIFTDFDQVKRVRDLAIAHFDAKCTIETTVTEWTPITEDGESAKHTCRQDTKNRLHRDLEKAVQASVGAGSQVWKNAYNNAQFVGLTDPAGLADQALDRFERGEGED